MRPATGQQSRVRTSPAGMTVLELLVVVAVTAILMALILPAVQSARESARRAECLTHVRQLAAATEGYVSVHGHYPGRQRRPLRESIHARLLPFVDYAGVYNRLDPAAGGRDSAEPPIGYSPNEFATDVSVPVFKCPSDDVPPGGNSYRGCAGSSTGFQITADRRTYQQTANAPLIHGRHGVFHNVATTAVVRDGKSMTMLFSERVVGDGDIETYTPFTDLTSTGGYYKFPNDALVGCAAVTGDGEHYSFLGWTWLIRGWSHTEYNHVLAPNSIIPDCNDNNSSKRFAQGAMTARSYHPGGVNGALADGSARFFSESIDLAVWRSLATHDGAEVIDGF